MNFFNKAILYNLGRMLCIFGFFAFSWNCAKWAAEEARLATVSDCVEFTKDDGSFPYGSSKIIPMIRCAAKFTTNGSNSNAVLTTRTPPDFDPNRLERGVVLITSRLSPQHARFASHPRDWSGGVSATLVLFFSGLLCINLGRKSA
jgi:hypothetical protein